MNDFVPDPNLVVEALRNHHAYHYQKSPKPLLHDDSSCEVDEALVHAEAVAEELTRRRQHDCLESPVLKMTEELNQLHINERDEALASEPAVQELIAAARGLEDDLGFPGPRHARLRAALNAFEDVSA